LTEGGSGKCNVGYLDGFFVDNGAPSVSVLRVVDADLFGVFGRSPLDALQKLVLDIVAELQAEGIVVGVLLTNVTCISPGGLGTGE
jgi:hypothetical protein